MLERAMTSPDETRGARLGEGERAVRAFLRGERQAFDDLARAYRPRIFGICYRYTGRPEDAEDLTQEVLLRVYRGLGTFRAEARFSTWLYRVAANACSSWLASEAKRQKAPLPEDVVDPSPTPLERLRRKETGARVRRAVAALPDRQRMTLVLRVYEELSLREVAEIMECPVGTVKANYFFALKNLRKKLSP